MGRPNRIDRLGSQRLRGANHVTLWMRQMRFTFGTMTKAAATALLLTAAGTAHADEVIASRLSALLGQERQSLSVVQMRAWPL